MKKIEDKFVPYDLALRLKNLGFDEPCFATYFTIGAWQIDCTEGALNLNNNKPTEYSILAPLWQDAFDWFREKYGLNSVSPTRIYKTDFYQSRIINWNTWEEIDVIQCSSYKEAELESLKKLIEIVKERK